MNSSEENTALLRIACRHGLFASLVTLTTCGGRSQDVAPHASGTPGSGGSTYATGGANATGGATGGATYDAGSCSDVDLFHEIRLAALKGAGGIAFCDVSRDPSFGGTYDGSPSHSVVLDGEGRIVVATGRIVSLMYDFADERWPCYANTTFYCRCTFVG